MTQLVVKLLRVDICINTKVQERDRESGIRESASGISERDKRTGLKGFNGSDVCGMVQTCM